MSKYCEQCGTELEDKALNTLMIHLVPAVY